MAGGKSRAKGPEPCDADSEAVQAMLRFAEARWRC